MENITVSQEFLNATEKGLDAMLYNLSDLNISTYLTVKEICYGLVGVHALLIIVFLFFLNLACFYWWRKLVEKKLKIFKKEYDLLYFLPFINGFALSYVFVYLFNAF